MDFLTQLRAQLAERIAARAAAKASIETILAAPASEGRSALTADETTAFNEARASWKAIDTEISDPATGLEARIADLELIESRSDKAAAVAPKPAAVQVRGEARTYRPDTESFFSDLYLSSTRSGAHRAAEERLARHDQEQRVDERNRERRNIGVSAMAGAVPPQYLLDQFAAVPRAGRPFLNSLMPMQLPPDGVSFVIPRGTTASAGAMTAEAAGWNEQDMANTDLTLTVNLVTAQQDISRTLLMRGGPVVDSIIFPDLLESLAVAANVSAINGSGTAPQHRGVLQVAGINAVTYTDASPSVPEAWPKLSDAIQRIASNRYLGATAIWMHPRRWAWITAAVDTTNRPLFNFSTMAPPNVVMGLGTVQEYGQIVGTLQNLPVITDASIPTTLGGGTEDIIIVGRAQDYLFWEDDVMTFTFEQGITTNPGEVRLAAGQFQLFSAGRYPVSTSTIGGTGLIAPTF